jgi:hypothetical protein
MQTKMRTLFLGILLFSAVNTGALFAQKPPYGIALDKTKTEFLDKTEIGVWGWMSYYEDMKNKYGDTSLEVKQILPDTALFRQVYGISFYPNPHPFIRLHPMTCVSHEQMLAYCQWRAEKVNEFLGKEKKSYRVTYVLPSKEDYEKALSKAIITQRLGISYVITKKRHFTGLTDNVAEYTIDKNVIVVGGDATQIETAQTTSNPVGFRCKAIVIKQ